MIYTVTFNPSLDYSIRKTILFASMISHLADLTALEKKPSASAARASMSPLC